MPRSGGSDAEGRPSEGHLPKAGNHGTSSSAPSKRAERLDSSPDPSPKSRLQCRPKSQVKMPLWSGDVVVPLSPKSDVLAAELRMQLQATRTARTGGSGAGIPLGGEPQRSGMAGGTPSGNMTGRPSGLSAALQSVQASSSSSRVPLQSMVQVVKYTWFPRFGTRFPDGRRCHEMYSSFRALPKDMDSSAEAELTMLINDHPLDFPDVRAFLAESMGWYDVGHHYTFSKERMFSPHDGDPFTTPIVSDVQVPISKLPIHWNQVAPLPTTLRERTTDLFRELTTGWF